MNIPSISINDVLGNQCAGSSILEAIELLSEVEVILGRDTSSQEIFLIFGRDRLRDVFRKPNDASDVDVLMIDIIRQSDELNQLLALVQMAKERFDYVEAA